MGAVRPNSPAAASGRVGINDQLLSVNTFDVGAVQIRALSQVTNYIQSAGSRIVLRLRPGPVASAAQSIQQQPQGHALSHMQQQQRQQRQSQLRVVRQSNQQLGSVVDLSLE